MFVLCTILKLTREGNTCREKLILKLILLFVQSYIQPKLKAINGKKKSRVELFRVIYGVYYTIKRLFYGSSGYHDTHLIQTI